MRSMEDIMAIRPTIIVQIREWLSAHDYFEGDDFEIKDTQLHNGTRILIQYRYDQVVHMGITLPSGTKRIKNPEAYGGYEDRYVIKVTTNPGKYATEDVREVYGFESVQPEVHQWLCRLYSDLQQAPEVRAYERNRVGIEQLLEAFGALEEGQDDAFSEEEQLDMLQRLRTAERTIQELVEQTSTDKTTAELHRRELEKDIEVLQRQLAVLSRKDWYWSLAVRLGKWATKTENWKLLTKGGRLVVGFLTDGSNSPPE